MQELIMSNIKTYRSGKIEYNIQHQAESHEGIPLPEQLTTHRSLPRYLGYIGYMLSESYEPILEFKTVYPLSEEPHLKRTGLGSFILSHTFLKIYNDSINSREIDPSTSILVDTSAIKLIKRLKNRGFQMGEFGYETTIQHAGEKSEQILSRRNWL